MKAVVNSIGSGDCLPEFTADFVLHMFSHQEAQRKSPTLSGSHLETKEKPTWATFSIPTTLTSILKSARWAHGKPGCEYSLISGPPTRNASKVNERFIMTLRDQDIFVPQFLRMQLYSLLIPANCTPSIGIELVNLTSVRHRTLSADSTREHCSGVLMVMAVGYQNPYQLQWQDDIEANPRYLDDRIICNQYALNVTVEVLAIGNGNLAIWALPNQKTDNQTAIPLNITKKLNFEANVSGVHVHWDPIGDTKDGLSFLLLQMSNWNWDIPSDQANYRGHPPQPPPSSGLERTHQHPQPVHQQKQGYIPNVQSQVPPGTQVVYIERQAPAVSQTKYLCTLIAISSFFPIAWPYMGLYLMVKACRGDLGTHRWSYFACGLALVTLFTVFLILTIVLIVLAFKNNDDDDY
ncbi:unnamed protein product, partial [Mesorhabditis belari]|uniref:Uncharacterized protein n=1 Tax=Mesorhabditis belari TaxID=2138241 RepID=A0AAF3EET8_9BILA